VAVVAAEGTAHEETLGRLAPQLLSDIEDAADAIQTRYDELMQQDLAQRVATRATRRR
jgi:hypothetical protein